MTHGGGRDHSTRSATAVNLSGPLGSECIAHARQRIVHFFLAATFCKLLKMRLFEIENHNYSYSSFIKPKASHQIDTGFREDETPLHPAFNKKDISILDLPVTSFNRIDAAHFCNLGIEATFANYLENYSDPIISYLWDGLKRLLGDTRLMPQLVNIGQDRVVDKFHGEFIFDLLGINRAIITETTIITYFTELDKRMGIYEAKQQKQGKVTMVAICQLYRGVYIPIEAEAIFRQLFGNIFGVLDDLANRNGEGVVPFNKWDYKPYFV